MLSPSVLLCALISCQSADASARDPSHWRFSSEPAGNAIDRYAQRGGELDRDFQTGRETAKQRYLSALRDGEQELQEEISREKGRDRRVAMQLRTVQETLSLLRSRAVPSARALMLETIWVDREHGACWLFREDESSLEIRSLDMEREVGAGKWVVKGDDRTVLARVDPAGLYEARRGLFVIALPEEPGGRRPYARIFWQVKSHSWELSNLLPISFGDGPVQEAKWGYERALQGYLAAHEKGLDEARVGLERDLQAAREKLLENPAGIDAKHVAEIDDALTRLRRKPAGLDRELAATSWRYEANPNAVWIFGKDKRLNFNRGTDHAPGIWIVLDRSVVLAQLGGFFAVDFDMESGRGHIEGFDRNGAKVEETLIAP